ncbi:FAD-dependent monooxygenase [Aliifodinibius sp. S!AR15-10]|uniref:FAD-dependent oxidoreductase n=1 Tax=Aliifodinibius sp. S!AR15-10 TaxID=2950437 RepID=UPI00285B5935|nr:FAD-dependent monooxygenase [Aliifodinibius sp. S!AR15-10]MDR8394304.1 FAD-dependent monooxygenase [Aliifodinibius sp. S!AR15-10]
MSQQDEYQGKPPPSVPGSSRAIVIGGGIAGLMTARVLGNHFKQVLVLERDNFPDGPNLRSGAPQGRHVHLLLLRGKQILEQLFPGLSRELIDNGARLIKMGEELGVLTYYGWRVQHAGKLSLLTFTQPLLEWCIRKRLTEIEAVEIIGGCRVNGLTADAKGVRVTGVRVRFGNTRQREHQLCGELVVDASGRFSRTPEWLSTLGYNSPEVSVVDPFLGYTSRFYEIPSNFSMPRSKWKALVLLGKPPDYTRGGVLLPVEGGRWHVTLVGTAKDYPPNDESGFIEFARTLRSRALYDAIKTARPLSGVAGYRSTKNRWRHYGSYQRWPRGFIVLGDALCSLNPVYAQGMSVAALEVMVLDKWLREYEWDQDNGAGVALHVQKELAKIIETPWLMATTDDARWPATEGAPTGLTTQMMHHYLDAVIALATRYPKVDDLFARVVHLLEPEYMLFHPRIALRAFARLLNPLSSVR